MRVSELGIQRGEMDERHSLVGWCERFTFIIRIFKSCFVLKSFSRDAFDDVDAADRNTEPEQRQCGALELNRNAFELRKPLPSSG